MTENLTFIEAHSDAGSDQKDSRDSNFYIYSVAESATQATVLIIIVIFGVLGNLYCVGVIYKNKKLRNPTFIFLCNLALCNISALLMCSPFPLITSFHRRNVLGPFWCRTSGFLNNFFFCSSIITFSLIAAQKYFTVVRPTKWRVLHITKTKARYLVVIVWIVCSILSIMVLGPFENWSYVVFNKTTAHCGISFPRNVSDRVRLGVLALAAFIAPIFIMSYAYTRIYLKVRAHENHILHSRKMASVKGKLAVTLGLMFGTFVFCWLPFFLLIVFSIAFQDASDLPWSLGRLAYWSGYLNCCINPTLYCWRSSAFREALKRRSSFARRRAEPFKRIRTPPRRSRRPNTLPPTFGRSLDNVEQIRPHQACSCCCGGQKSEGRQRPARLRALSFSSSYDLTKASRVNEDASDVCETYLFLEDGLKSTNHVLSTFGAQHALLSIRSALTEAPYTASAHRPEVSHKALQPSAKSVDTQRVRESETYI